MTRCAAAHRLNHASRRLTVSFALALAALAIMAASAQAAPVTIDFESGASVGDLITNQYATHSGVPEGPTFMTPTAAGFTNPSDSTQPWSPECGPGHLSNDTANSGSNSVKLDGCFNGEFWPTSTLFAMGYTTDAVSFYVAVSGSIFSSDTVVTTAFDANHNKLEQVTTTFGAQSGPTWQQVSLSSGSDNIAYVAVEHGIADNNGASPSGVTEGAGNVFLYLDDLTYDPPASPPASSFVVGANPGAAATTEGGQVKIDIPITWFNNPNPSADPVSLSASTPTGVTPSFSPPVTSTGDSKLTLDVAPSAPPGQYSVTVTGTVGVKTSSVTIPFGISSPLEVGNLGPATLAPCTPKTLTVTAQTNNVTEPVTISVDTSNQPQVRILSISGSGGPGTVTDPSHASVTVTPSGGVGTATLNLFVQSGGFPVSAQHVDVQAAASGYPTQSNTVGTLAIEEGHVDSVLQTGTSFSPTFVSAPALGKPGTALTLHGAGFCPGTLVSIGDPTHPATPTSIAGDGTSLTFNVPRGATTGPLEVVPSEAGSFNGPSLTVETFRDTWGFSWTNGSYGTTFTPDMEQELFGFDETHILIPPFFIPVLKPEAIEYGIITNKHVGGGLCFGIAYSSLQFFAFPDNTSPFPSTGGSTPWDLDSSGAPSSSLLRFVTEHFSLQFTDQLIPVALNAAIGIHGPDDDLNAIKAELAGGHPVMIGMVEWSGLSDSGHTVLAYDTHPLANGDTAIDVVNSNVPYNPSEATNPSMHESNEFTNSQIIYHADGSWTFPEGAQIEGSSGPWSGSEADMVVYPNAKLPILNGQDPKLPNVFTGLALVVFGSAGDGVTQLSGGGSSLFTGGDLAPQSSWPKGVAPLPNFNGSRGPLQFAALEPGQAGPITATVHRHAGGGAMDLTLPGLQAALQGGAHSGEIDHVSVDPRTDTIGYQSGSPSPFSGSLLSAPGAQAAATESGNSLSDHVVQFQTRTSRNGRDTLAFPSGRQFVLTHTGAPANLTLTLSGFTSTGLPIAVQLPAVRLANGETLRAAPSSWNALASGAVRITSTLHGRTTVKILHGRPIGGRFATLQRARVVKLAHGRYAIALKLRIRGASAQRWLSIAVSVLKGGRTIERAAPAQLSGASLRSGTVTLTLPHKLTRGHHTLLVRLLEATMRGMAQGSVMVSPHVRVPSH